MTKEEFIATKQAYDQWINEIIATPERKKALIRQPDNVLFDLFWEEKMGDEYGDNIKGVKTYNVLANAIKSDWDGRCKCGHLHSEHHPVQSHNYSAGRCTVGECRCAYFINDPPKLP